MIIVCSVVNNLLKYKKYLAKHHDMIDSYLSQAGQKVFLRVKDNGYKRLKGYTLNLPRDIIFKLVLYFDNLIKKKYMIFLKGFATAEE